MTSSEHVLRVTRSDSEGSFVLLNVSSNGPEPLDLRIQATEGENPYAADIKSSRVSKLREKKSFQTDPQWVNTLLTILLQRPTTPESGAEHPNESIETVASISPSSLSLIFRKNISGITQRLGEISLHRDDALELDTISWTSVAISRGNELEAQVRDLTVKHVSARHTVSALNQQLEELIAAKQALEDALLSKFKVLLNEKKVKIRDQQRLLAQANIHGPATVTKKEEPKTVMHKAAASRRGKRKAEEAALGEGRNDAEEEEEAAFEGPASSTRVKDEDMDEELDGLQETPDASGGDTTEDEDEEEKDGGGIGEKVGDDALEGQRMEVDVQPPSISDLPPNRELPFQKDNVKKPGEMAQRQPLPEPAEEQETDDDDDDEL